ncbi:unnamed protein product [Blepharisma stoltei]|uniref:Uncharacterized protein n=1 Tax=Blepharisma stoltei TaxID=1481888 RepID=A0AAU9K338_9CILI|nr:unnamed protein product [Blepharisma stoltei]
MGETTEKRYQRIERELRDLCSFLFKQISNLDGLEINTYEITNINSLNPIQLIEKVRDKIHSLLQFKSQAQQQDKDQVFSQIQDYQEIVQNLEKDLRNKAKEEQQLRLKLESAETKLEQAEQSKEELAKSSKELIDEIKKDNQSLIDLLKMKEMYIDDLKGQIESHRQVILGQEDKIASVPKLEQNIKELEKKYQIDMTKMTVKHSNEMSQSSKELKQYHKIIALNAQYEEKIKQLSMELESYRRQFHKTVDNGGRMEQLQELISNRSKSVQKLEIECNRMKVKLDNKQLEVQKLTKQVAMQQKEIEDLKKLKKPQEFAKEEPYDTNLALVKHYKKKLEEKEAELKEANKRIRKMYKMEIKGKIKEDGFDNERKMYMNKIGELCHVNMSLESMVKKKVQSGTWNEDENSEFANRKEGVYQANYENMKELAKSASEAYSVVLQKNKNFQKFHIAGRLGSSQNASMSTTLANKSTRPNTAGALSSTRSLTKLMSARKSPD